MPYKLLRFEKEKSGGAGHPTFIAIVEKEGEEQPFRVLIEHFETAAEAKFQVDRWIETQDEDDARFLAEQENRKKREAEDIEEDSLLNELNASF